MKSKHNRTFVPGGVALVKGRLKHSLKQMPQEELEELILKGKFLQNAPFLWVGLVFRYGIKNNLKIDSQGINKQYGDLSVALELDMDILKWADQNNLDLLRDIFMIASLEALIQVGQKYKLPIEAFIAERTKYGDIPNTIEECENYSPVRLE